MYVINRATANKHTEIPINIPFIIESFTSAVAMASTHFLIKGVINVYGVMVLSIVGIWRSMSGQSMCWHTL